MDWQNVEKSLKKPWGVETMTTQHIRNTLAWIERNDPLDILMPWVNVFMEELERRGEEE